MLIDCILVRTVDASLPVTGGSAKNGLSGGTSTGSLVPFCIITAYLPSAGEYALEVYGAPADSEEDTSYFLVWQFMIDADCGVCLSTPVRKRLATTNLGPQDETWSQLGIRTVSHPDPLIHVPTKGIRGLQRARSKNELMKQFVQKAEKVDHDHARQSLSVSHGSDAEKDENADEPIGPLSCDLRIVLEKPAASKLCIVGQLVDISEPTEELFTDVCEYRVEARGADPDSSVTAKPGSIDIPPFPPTSQSHYGPTEKAIELQLQAVPPDISAVRKCVDGVFEVRFATTEPVC
ncbi:unnamed protein product [Dicrocoelium dendriticum]|nr:unnamed protein product [Dicrocoelium dendriticum]